MLTGHRVFQGVLVDWTLGPRSLFRVDRQAWAGIGVLSILVRGQDDVVAANAHGFIC